VSGGLKQVDQILQVGGLGEGLETYPHETSFSSKDEERFGNIEIKMAAQGNKRYEVATDLLERTAGRMWGPVKEKDRVRIRYTNEECMLYGEPCTAVVVNLKGLKWAGCTERMVGKCVSRKIRYNTVCGKRPVGKPERR
jgi:hypothetical protein